MARESPTRKSSSGVILDISDTLLTTIGDAARLSPIPYFQEAAGLALGILQIVQGTKDNKEGFQSLAGDVCTLVYAIISVSQEKNGLSVKDLDNLRELLGTLGSIERFARKNTSRSLLFRTIRHKSDAGKIQRYREKVRHSLDLFDLKASISIQESLNRINRRQDEFLIALQESLRIQINDGKLNPVGHESNFVGDSDNAGSSNLGKTGNLNNEAAELERRRLQENEVKEKAEPEGVDDGRELDNNTLERQGTIPGIPGTSRGDIVGDIGITVAKGQGGTTDEVDQELAEIKERERKIEHDRLVLRQMERERIKKLRHSDGSETAEEVARDTRERARMQERERKIELALQRIEQEKMEKLTASEARVMAEETERVTREKAEREAERECIEELERTAELRLGSEQLMTAGGKQPEVGEEPGEERAGHGEHSHAEPMQRSTILHEAQDQLAPVGGNEKRRYSSKNPFLLTSPAAHVSGRSFTSIGGNYVKTDSSQHISNTNSGNVTSTTITDSNNDSSQRIYHQLPRRGRMTL